MENRAREEEREFKTKTKGKKCEQKRKSEEKENSQSNRPNANQLSRHEGLAERTEVFLLNLACVERVGLFVLTTFSNEH